MMHSMTRVWPPTTYWIGRVTKRMMKETPTNISRLMKWTLCKVRFSLDRKRASQRRRRCWAQSSAVNLHRNAMKIKVISDTVIDP